jgi:hypothetical protein
MAHIKVRDTIKEVVTVAINACGTEDWSAVKGC